MFPPVYVNMAWWSKMVSDILLFDFITVGFINETLCSYHFCSSGRMYAFVFFLTIEADYVIGKCFKPLDCRCTVAVELLNGTIVVEPKKPGEIWHSECNQW